MSVYGLFEDERCVYVGASRNVISRKKDHFSKWGKFSDRTYLRMRILWSLDREDDMIQSEIPLNFIYKRRVHDSKSCIELFEKGIRFTEAELSLLAEKETEFIELYKPSDNVYKRSSGLGGLLRGKNASSKII